MPAAEIGRDLAERKGGSRPASGAGYAPRLTVGRYPLGDQKSRRRKRPNKHHADGKTWNKVPEKTLANPCLGIWVFGSGFFGHRSE